MVYTLHILNKISEKMPTKKSMICREECKKWKVSAHFFFRALVVTNFFSAKIFQQCHTLETQLLCYIFSTKSHSHSVTFHVLKWMCDPNSKENFSSNRMERNISGQLHSNTSLTPNNKCAQIDIQRAEKRAKSLRTEKMG